MMTVEREVEQRRLDFWGQSLIVPQAVTVVAKFTLKSYLKCL